MDSVQDPHVLTFHTDPGHGWLEVSKQLARQVLGGRYREISSHSYASRTAVYLEEDCDAPMFLKAAREKGINFQIHEPFEDNNSIRQMASFRSYRS
jgi:predicted RNase H-like nuclease